MLVLIHVVLHAFESPRVGAFDARKRAAANGHRTFGAQNVVAVFVMATGNLAMHHVRASALRVQVVYFDMVEDIAALGRNRAATDRRATNGRLIAKSPLHFIHGVDALFHQAIAAHPAEVIPIAQLPLHIANAGRPIAGRRHWLHRVRQVSAVVRDQVADGSLLHLLKGGPNVIRIAPTEARNHAKFLLLGELGGLHYAAHAGRVDGDRLLHEEVLVGLHRRAIMHRPEPGRRGQNHHVNVGGE